MKFLNFLNERNDPLIDFYEYFDYEDEFNYLPTLLLRIYNDCKPILKIYSQTMSFCYRGTNNTSTFFEEKVEKNRKSKFIPIELHKILGEFAKKYHGWNFREEGLFCASESLARQYSDRVHIIFPKKDFKYVYFIDPWNKLYDLYDKITIGMRSRENEISDFQDVIDELENKYRNKYKNKNLEKVLSKNSDFECIFDCDSYYALNSAALKNILLKFLLFLKDRKLI